MQEPIREPITARKSTPHKAVSSAPASHLSKEHHPMQRNRPRNTPPETQDSIIKSFTDNFSGKT